jgi:hypothetical protein
MNIEFVRLKTSPQKNWKNFIGISFENLEIYVPHIFFHKNETAALMLASYDCSGVCIFKKHAFFPLSWVMREFIKDETEKQELLALRNKLLAIKLKEDFFA